MVFNSVEFFVFLLSVLGLYHGVLARASWRVRKGFLTVVSYLFYMSWSPSFGLLLLGSTLIDFFLALRMERMATRAGRRALLLISLTFNLGMLGFFKYGSFISTNVYDLFGWSGDPMWAAVALPIGISFYTFESLSYTIDVYRGEAACRNLLDFALFLSFFPHLVAGPIVRPRDFLPQLERQPAIVPAAVELALARIAQGFLKKVVLADGIGVYVDMVWHDPVGCGLPNMLVALYGYAFQIYFDFSGYTDIALGVAQLFGLTLPENFDRPYLAANAREFWQRWHISLSTWLRDYLYVSLGGNRRGPVQTYVNLFLTMLLGGLWHGAAWNFVLWGGYHGLLLAGHRAWSAWRPPVSPGRGRVWLSRLATFHLVCLGWILFRGPSLDSIGAFLAGFGRLTFEPSRAMTQATIYVAIGVILHGLPPAQAVRRRWVTSPAVLQGAGYAIVTILAFLLSPASERFIYFQF